MKVSHDQLTFLYNSALMMQNERVTCQSVCVCTFNFIHFQLFKEELFGVNMERTPTKMSQH